MMIIMRTIIIIIIIIIIILILIIIMIIIIIMNSLSCHKEKNTCQIVDFAIPADHRVEIKEREKREKY